MLRLIIVLVLCAPLGIWAAENAEIRIEFLQKEREVQERKKLRLLNELSREKADAEKVAVLVLKNLGDQKKKEEFSRKLQNEQQDVAKKEKEILAVEVKLVQIDKKIADWLKK